MEPEVCQRCGASNGHMVTCEEATLTLDVNATDMSEAFAKARLLARQFFVEGHVHLNLVVAELASWQENASGKQVSPATFRCRFTAWRDEEKPTELNVVRLEDVAIALIDSRTAYQLADNFTPNQSQMHDAVSLVGALERQGYRIVRKDGH